MASAVRRGYPCCSLCSAPVSTSAPRYQNSTPHICATCITKVKDIKLSNFIKQELPDITEHTSVDKHITIGDIVGFTVMVSQRENCCGFCAKRYRYSKACVNCTVCQKYMCEDCMVQHQSNDRLCSHKLQYLSRTKTCQTHHKPMTLFCQSCSIDLCKNCLRGGFHDRHTVGTNFGNQFKNDKYNTSGSLGIGSARYMGACKTKARHEIQGQNSENSPDFPSTVSDMSDDELFSTDQVSSGGAASRFLGSSQTGLARDIWKNAIADITPQALFGKGNSFDVFETDEQRTPAPALRKHATSVQKQQFGLSEEPEPPVAPARPEPRAKPRVAPRPDRTARARDHEQYTELYDPMHTQGAVKRSSVLEGRSSGIRFSAENSRDPAKRPYSESAHALEATDVNLLDFDLDDSESRLGRFESEGSTNTVMNLARGAAASTVKKPTREEWVCSYCTLKNHGRHRKLRCAMCGGHRHKTNEKPCKSCAWFNPPESDLCQKCLINFETEEEVTMMTFS